MQRIFTLLLLGLFYIPSFGQTYTSTVMNIIEAPAGIYTFLVDANKCPAPDN